MPTKRIVVTRRTFDNNNTDNNIVLPPRGVAGTADVRVRPVFRCFSCVYLVHFAHAVVRLANGNREPAAV